MKKIILVVLALVMVLTLGACGKKVECNLCGEEVSPRKAHADEIFGKEIYICNDCYEDLEDIQEGIGNLFN